MMCRTGLLLAVASLSGACAGPADGTTGCTCAESATSACFKGACMAMDCYTPLPSWCQSSEEDRPFCVDVRSDPKNCGSCFHACASSECCQQGVCQKTACAQCCPLLAPICVNGACACTQTTCPGGYECRSGTCQLPAVTDAGP